MVRAAFRASGRPSVDGGEVVPRSLGTIGGWWGVDRKKSRTIKGLQHRAEGPAHGLAALVDPRALRPHLRVDLLAALAQVLADRVDHLGHEGRVAARDVGLEVVPQRAV